MMQNNNENISWSKDLQSTSTVQKNLLWMLNFVFGIAIILCLIWMQITLSQSRIEPFVIEIDKKTGIATTVDQVSVEEYSSNTAVLRSLIIQYIRAREEYVFQLFNTNYFDVVRVFSSPSIYYNYKSRYSPNNPNSPYSTLGKSGSTSVKWKSIIFPDKNTAQIRISIQVQDAAGAITNQTNKIILLSFEFDPSTQMPEEDRLINPLGFIVTMYKIEDENPNM